MKNKAQAIGYRLDIPLKDAAPGVWVEYTPLKAPLALEMAESLGRYHKRQHQPGRIVKVTGREKAAAEFVEMVEEWNA